jgi:hypothetical protein
MAAVPRTKVLVVSYPRTGPQGRNQEANEDKILSGSAAARTDVYGSGAAERRSRPAMRDWQWWRLKSPSSHEASSASTARAARLIALRLFKSRNPARSRCFRLHSRPPL